MSHQLESCLKRYLIEVLAYPNIIHCLFMMPAAHFNAIVSKSSLPLRPYRLSVIRNAIMSDDFWTTSRLRMTTITELDLATLSESCTHQYHSRAPDILRNQVICGKVATVRLQLPCVSRHLARRFCYLPGDLRVESVIVWCPRGDNLSGCRRGITLGHKSYFTEAKRNR